MNIKQQTPQQIGILAATVIVASGLLATIYLIIKRATLYKGIADDNLKMIETLHPKIRNYAVKFLKEAEKQAFNLRITSATRTFAEQNALYAQGRTTGGQIVTNAPQGTSWHNYSLAFDIVDRDKGYETDWNALDKIAEKVGLEHPLKWDLPHFQKTFGLTISECKEKIQNNETKNGYIII